MTINKLTLALSVATLLGAASAVLADETPPIMQPDDDLYVGGRTADQANEPAFGYRLEQGYLPRQQLQSRDIIPPRTVPLGEVPPSEFESTDSSS